MAKIFFNDKVVKTLPEPTILNWFSQEDGTTIFLRDTRSDTYVGRGFIYGDLVPYKKDGDYYVDIVEQKQLDGAIAGVYISEGSDFEIRTTQGREPLFLVRQKATAMALGMRPLMNKGIDVKEVALGLFFEGSEISYNRDGVNITDRLTQRGWERISGATDSQLGIITTEDAYRNKLENDKAFEESREKKIEKLRQSLDVPGVNKAVVQALIKAKLDRDPRNTHIFLLSDMKKLKEQKII